MINVIQTFGFKVYTVVTLCFEKEIISEMFD